MEGSEVGKTARPEKKTRRGECGGGAGRWKGQIVIKMHDC